MLSKRDIEKELGKGISIVPFIEENLKDNSINLTTSKYAWGTTSQTYYYNNETNPIYISEDEIPENKRKYYKPRKIRKGGSVVINKGNRKLILLFPHSTTYIETLEVLSTNSNIGGTCHSKVGTAALGVGHIGTMMGPNYSGNCFVPLHNPTNKLIVLPVGETFMSVVFNYLNTPIEERNATTGGHTDKFSQLGIQATSEALQELNQDWKRSHHTVSEQMKMDRNFLSFKKRLFRKKLSLIFRKKNLFFAGILIIVCILLGAIAFYIDSKNGTTLWVDRFWSIMGAGIVVYILQLLSPKNMH